MTGETEAVYAGLYIKAAQLVPKIFKMASVRPTNIYKHTMSFKMSTSLKISFRLS